MCGRYTLTVQEQDLIAEFDLIAGDIGDYAVRYNIAPTQNAPVVRVIESRRRVDPLRWGLIPHWAKDIKIGNRMINARSEEAESKPAFRNALRMRRCLVPCTGFFEWKVLDDGNSTRPGKQPYYIRRADERVFALAGMWERWHAPNGSTVESYTILTTAPNDLLSTLHDRMPVIISPDEYALWLDPNMQDAIRLRSLFSPFPARDFVAKPVSTKVNSPANDSPECIHEVD